MSRFPRVGAGGYNTEDSSDFLNLPDESYQGPPASGFEDSQGTNVLGFRAGMNLNGPTDFGFLMGAQQPQKGDDGALGGGGDFDMGGGTFLEDSRGSKRSRVIDEGVTAVVAQLRGPPKPAMRPTEVPFGAVDGEDRGERAMKPPLTRTDPFHWMRDDEHTNEEVQTLLKDEDAHCKRSLAHLQRFREQLYAEMIGHTKEDDLDLPAPDTSGYAYYSRSFKGKAYSAHYRAKVVSGSGSGQFAGYVGNGVATDVSSAAALVGMELRDEELLLDENLLRVNGETPAYLATSGPSSSLDCKIFSYALDVEGNGCHAIHFRTLTGGVQQDLPDVLERTSGDMDWGPSGMYYIKLDKAFRAYALHHYCLATKNDTVVFEESDARFSLSMGKTSDNRYLIVNSSSSETSESYLLDMSNPSSKLVCVCPRQFGHRFDIDHRSGMLYIMTNKDGAKDMKLCRTPVPSVSQTSAASWETVWKPDESVSIESIHCFAKFMTVELREKSVHRIAVLNYDELHAGGCPNIHAVAFPETQLHTGTVLTPRSRTAATSLYSCGLHTNHIFDTDTVRVWYCSYIVPSRIYAYHIPTRSFKLLKQEPAPGYDASLYRCERIMSNERDVPISLVYRQDLHSEGLNGGPYPTLLTGYGAYGACQDPEFDQTILSLLDRGVLYAIAHVRGGGELGRAWYEQGRYLHVKNRFLDFAAAADTLLALGVAARSRLAAWGESSGGLLVSATANMRPDLFKAVLLEVPFVDAMNTMADPTIPLTVGEWEEIGNPNERETFHYMMEYSPYDNLRMQNYPAALCTAALHDSMVGFWEPLKYVSKLRRLKTDYKPVLLKVNFHAGHGHSSDRYEYLLERSFNFAFVLEQLGLWNGAGA
eukprot:TRINITY_DN14178_c0_g1_i2.p1 TRINITY_DN14178_c0_g1~~TRINITY_DN14178_c0_g1_i2.p1  ORF type:complete len:894 (+),score=144.57 TRINITY_DN14178_c0_g1_i2:68-2683(+)